VVTKTSTSGGGVAPCRLNGHSVVDPESRFFLESRLADEVMHKLRRNDSVE